MRYRLSTDRRLRCGCITVRAILQTTWTSPSEPTWSGSFFRRSYLFWIFLFTCILTNFRVKWLMVSHCFRVCFSIESIVCFTPDQYKFSVDRNGFKLGARHPLVIIYSLQESPDVSRIEEFSFFRTEEYPESTLILRSVKLPPREWVLVLKSHVCY